MKKKQLIKVEKLIDEIFNSQNLNFIEVSNSLLHIHRCQSDFLARYAESYVDENSGLVNIKKAQSRTTLFSQKSIRLKEKYLSNSCLEFDILIVSHFVSKSKNQPYSDFYFSQIIASLLKAGYRVKVVYINDVDEALLRCINKKNKQLHYDVINNKLPVHLAVFFLTRILFHSISYRFKALFNTNSEKKTFYKTVSRMESSWTNLSTSYNIGRIVKKGKPKFLFTTFEGQSYERLIYYFSKKFHKDIICIGYFHAALFEHQISVKKRIGNNFDPEIIFTQGEFSKRNLKKSFEPFGIKVFTIGSPRPIRFDFKSIKDKSVLIIPSGIKQEVFFLLNFSLKLSQLLHEFKFHFRLHPSFNTNDINTFLTNTKIPSNFFFSKNSLDDDASHCKFTFYRDSTAVLTAAALGSLPVFIRKKEEDIIVNPLYGISDFIPFVFSPEDFILQLKHLTPFTSAEYVSALNDIVSQYEENQLFNVINSYK